MANPVTYNNNTNPTGALKSGTVSMSVASSLNITGYNWRNGFENNNIWVIYSDTYSQGLSTQGNSLPTIWATPIFTEQGLIDLINVLPARAGQSKFTTLSSAISWLYGEGKYFISNQNYPFMVVDGLKFFTDPGFTASYPNVGTTLYDLSNGNNGTLVNGPTWTNSNTKSYFNFDGTDDTISTPIPLTDLPALSNFSMECWASISQYPSGVGGEKCGVLFGATYYCGVALYWYGNSSGNNLSVHSFIRGNDAYRLTQGFSMSLNRYYHFVLVNNHSETSFSLYVNGVLIDTIAGPTEQYNSGLTSSAGNIGISKAQIDGGGTLIYSNWNGSVNKAKIYTKALSSTEILQNYYQGPIVTSNLTYLWDAGNIVSYVSGAGTTYDLKSSGINGTLQNGVGYSNNFSGYWSFDGADDRIVLTSSITPGNGNWTFNAWVRGNGSVIGNTSGGPVASSFGILSSKIFYANYSGVWNDHYGNTTLNPGEWYMLTWVNYSDGSGTMKMYVNGVADSSVFSSYTTNGGPLDVIGFDQYAMGSFTGSIGAVQFNSGKSFTDSEVNQQYGATKGRFASFSAYANGGTVTTITENGTTYRVHTFTSSGTLSVVKGGEMEVLVLAGGGGGGAYAAGAGAGAGGLIYQTGYFVTSGNKTVTVGSGGAGAVYTVSSATNGNNSVLDNLTATGGGYGGQGWAGQAGSNGGSGGGGGGYDGTQGTYTTAGGTGVASQGFDGGVGRGISVNRGAGGGGGGAGAKGGDSTTNSGGNGGNGRQISINGTATYYAGGGGGGDYGSANGGQGGLGGGGNVSGGNGSGVPAGNGTVNTGGGGGGSRSASSDSWNGGNGGSGIVIVRYPIY